MTLIGIRMGAGEPGQELRIAKLGESRDREIAGCGRAVDLEQQGDGLVVDEMGDKPGGGMRSGLVGGIINAREFCLSETLRKRLKNIYRGGEGAVGIVAGELEDGLADWVVRLDGLGLSGFVFSGGESGQFQVGGWTGDDFDRFGLRQGI